MKESTLMGLGYVLLIVAALVFAAQCARFARRHEDIDEPAPLIDEWSYSTRTQAVSP